MKIATTLAACALVAAGCASMNDTATHRVDAAPHADRIVVQVSDNDPAKWNLTLNNARNVQTDLGEKNVEIEIVAYGPGLNMLKTGSPVAQRIDESVMRGMKIVACENTMKAQKVTRDQILPGVDYVPAGVVEIMRKQQEGWAYLRP